MDPEALVGQERVKRAGEFLRRLREEGMDLDGAMWAHVEGDGRPYLYIVSPNVESDGPIQADLRMGRVLRQFQPEPADPRTRIDPFGIKLIAPYDSVAKSLRVVYSGSPGPYPIVYRGGSWVYGTVLAEGGAYIYPRTVFAAAVTSPSAS